MAHAGKHSKGDAVLKFAVKEMIVDRKFDYYEDMENGVFLIRLRG